MDRPTGRSCLPTCSNYLQWQALDNPRPVHVYCVSLQEEGKKLKKFAEKRMKDGRPTHISSMFLCQVCALRVGVWRLLCMLDSAPACLCALPAVHGHHDCWVACGACCRGRALRSVPAWRLHPCAELRQVPDCGCRDGGTPLQVLPAKVSERFHSRLLFVRAAANNQQLPVGLGSMRRGPLASASCC